MTRNDSAVGMLLTLVGLSSSGLVAAERSAAALRDLYKGPGSVHLRASVEVTVHRPLGKDQVAPVQGSGFVEHWEQGDRFRTVVWIDPDLGLMGNIDIAYDGDDYQLYLLDSQTLAVERPPFRSHGLLPVPTPVPNPFYLPVSYLAPSDDDCPACQLTLEFLRQDGVWPELGDAAADSFEMPGGARHSVGYYFRIHGPREAGSDEGQRIDRLGLDDALWQSVVLARFSDGFPHWIEVTGYEPGDPEGSPRTTVRYRIEELTLNADLDAAVFTIAPERDTAVWLQGMRSRSD